MDILKKLLKNPAFDHLAENILGFMDIDKAVETMNESKLFWEKFRLRKILRKLMVKEAQMYCEKRVIFKSRCGLANLNPSLYTMYPFFKEALQELKNSESLESFNQLYDILVWLQPGQSQSKFVVRKDSLHKFWSQLTDETQLQRLYSWSRLNRCPFFKGFKGPEGMLGVFVSAAWEDWDESREKSREMDPYVNWSDYDGYDSPDSSIEMNSFVHSFTWF